MKNDCGLLVEMVRVVSWNVNGWRAIREKPFFDEMVKQYDPDIICLQETKINKNVSILYEGYKVVSHTGTRPGYSGTAILYKPHLAPIRVNKNKTEGRLIRFETKDFVLFNVYVPNSGEKLARLDYRVNTWDKKFKELLMKEAKNNNVLLVGDMNVARTATDIKNAEQNKNNAGFTEKERASFESLLKETTLIDVWRETHPKKTQYTYWSYRLNARSRNAGWRIDYALASPSLSVDNCEILDNVLGSDHAPVLIDLAITGKV